ncbi:MAG: hypothetical protein EHM17_11955, partial [Verrucomicrobiaceae bacterium]
MARLATPWTTACAALATALLTSCGLRLPVEKAQELQRVEVGINSPATPQRHRDPDLLVWLIADSYHTGLVVPYDWLLESGFVPPA